MSTPTHTSIGSSLLDSEDSEDSESVTFTNNYARLVGMWIQIGKIKFEEDKVIGIEFGIFDDMFDTDINFICSQLKNAFNIEPEKTELLITLNSCEVGNIFMDLFVNSTTQLKELNNVVFGWTKKMVINFMYGFHCRDYVTSNDYLLNQLYHLCKNNGLNLSFSHKRHDTIVCKDIINKNMEKNNLLKIISIEQVDRNDEYVYTLGVDNDHSYTVEGLIVENCYLEPWHADVYEFVELRQSNSGNDENRTKDLFLASWIPDLFMKRVENDEMWSLMCPNECPNLDRVHGEEFENLYVKYENENKYKRQVKARHLWNHLLKCQIETGFTYMCYKDNVNLKSNQKNLGTIRCSNLCAEIVEYTDAQTIAVCNLASICLPRFVDTIDGIKHFDYDLLEKIVRIIVRNLNKIVDINYYPTESAKISNKKNRPLGIGIQGLHNVYNEFGCSYESEDANVLNKMIFETIYYSAIDESKELAKIYGSYESFDKSPFSEGKLQFHLWGLDENDLLTKDKYKWNELIEDVKKYGTLNSLLTALMPTAGTSQIMGCYESFEPFISNIFIKTTMAGEFIVINENLMRDLIELNLWDEDMRKLIIINNGSIQNIESIPNNIKDIYKTAFELKLKALISQSADRGPFIDQSQSLNLFMKSPDPTILTSAHFYAWKRGLKTGMYYLRSTSAVNPIQFGIDITDVMRLTGKTSIIDMITEDFNIKNKNTDDTNDTNTKKICKFTPGKPAEGCLMCSS
jgi:ribonucleoside-diphosphate reductase alpha subunit